jgi:hypothetical protein
VDVPAAREVLGLGARPSWDEVRAAYRERIVAAHPDRAGGNAAQAAVLNDAYTTLLRARRDGSLHRPPPPAATATGTGAPAAGPAVGPVEVLEGDRVRLPLSPDDAFRRLVEAADRIGDVTYVDRSCAIFEALVPVAGEGACSLVVTLQPAGRGATEAFCTLEAIERVASPPVRPVVEQLVAALGARGFTDR